MGSRFNEWECCRAVVCARVAFEEELWLLGWCDYDYCAVAPPHEFVVVPRRPRRRILDNHRWEVASVVLWWLVPRPRSLLVICAHNMFGGDAAEAR